MGLLREDGSPKPAAECFPAGLGICQWFHFEAHRLDSSVHWLRRLIFRGAWLDQRVLEGELEVVFIPFEGSFCYVQPDRPGEPIELSPEPSWRRVAYGR